jgi:hypothetical protein
MKKYLVQNVIEAEPMLKTEAEARLGHEIEGNKKEVEGFLTCDLNKLKWGWVSQNRFRGDPFDTQSEQLMVCYKQLEYWQEFFRTYNKIKSKESNLPQAEQARVYKANRHIKLLLSTIKEIININLIQR